MSIEIPDDDFPGQEGGETLTRAGRGASARIRAPQRQEPARENNREAGTRLQRNRKRSDDKFYVDPSLIPQGMSYEWKREACYGQTDPDHMVNLADNHWKPVPMDRHPGMVLKKDGMILMERPSYLTQEARAEDYDIAVGQVKSVRNSLSDTPEGQFDRNHPSARRATSLKSDFNLSIPEE